MIQVRKAKLNTQVRINRRAIMSEFGAVYLTKIMESVFLAFIAHILNDKQQEKHYISYHFVL